MNIPCHLGTSLLIFSSAVEHWSGAHSCPRSCPPSAGLVGAVLDKRIDGFTARSLAPRSCYSISPKVHCSTRERRFYYTQRAWPPSSMVTRRYVGRKSIIFIVPITSSTFVHGTVLFEKPFDAWLNIQWRTGHFAASLLHEFWGKFARREQFSTQKL